MALRHRLHPVILEIRLPHDASGGTLWQQLLALWPSYFAFALSFFVILVTWITHHDLMQLVRATDRPARLANGCALLYVTFIPFPTAVLAEHLGGPEMTTAVAFYCGTFVVGSAFFNLRSRRSLTPSCSCRGPRPRLRSSGGATALLSSPTSPPH